MSARHRIVKVRGAHRASEDANLKYAVYDEPSHERDSCITVSWTVDHHEIIDEWLEAMQAVPLPGFTNIWRLPPGSFELNMAHIQRTNPELSAYVEEQMHFYYDNDSISIDPDFYHLPITPDMPAPRAPTRSWWTKLWDVVKKVARKRD